VTANVRAIRPAPAQEIVALAIPTRAFGGTRQRHDARPPLAVMLASFWVAPSA